MIRRFQWSLRAWIVGALSFAAAGSCLAASWGCFRSIADFSVSVGPVVYWQNRWKWELALQLGSRRDVQVMLGSVDGVGCDWATYVEVGAKHPDSSREGWSRSLTLGPAFVQFYSTGSPPSWDDPPTNLSVTEMAHWNLAWKCVRAGAAAWFPPLFFAAYPLWAFYRGPWRRRRRKAKGLCVPCGYDLTGNVTGVCSECGAKVVRRGVPETRTERVATTVPPSEAEK